LTGNCELCVVRLSGDPQPGHFEPPKRENRSGQVWRTLHFVHLPCVL